MSKIGLLALGVLLGIFIHRGSTNDNHLGTVSHSSLASNDRNSRSTHFAKSSSVGPRGKEVASRSLPAGHQGSYGALLDRLVDSHSGDFQRIMKSKEDEGIRAFLINLASKDPEGVLAVINDDPSLSEDAGLLLSVAIEVASKNPISAYELIASQRGALSPEAFNSVLAATFPSIANSDPRYAATWIDKITDPKDREVAMIQLSEAWVSKDPKEALGWLHKVMQSGASSQTVESCYEKILLGSLKDDPLMVIQTVSRLESGKFLRHLVPEIGAKLAETDFKGACDWVKSVNDPDARQAGLERIVNFHAQTNPELTFDLVLGELNGADSRSHPLLSSLTKYHPELVMKRLASLPTASQPEAAEGITLSIVERDGPGAGLESWINQLSPGETFDRATEIFALNEVSRDPLNAMEFAVKVGNSKTREELFARLVEVADIEAIPVIYGSLTDIQLDSEGYERLQQQISKRMIDEQTSLVLPE